MEATHNSPLEERPKGLNIIRMHDASYIFALTVTYRFVREAARFEQAIARMFVCGDQFHLLTNGLTNKPIRCWSIRVLDYLADDITLPANGSDDSDFAAALAATDVRFLVPVAILVLTTNKRFVNFNLTHEARELIVCQHRADTMADIESGLVGGWPTIFLKLPLNLKSAHALLGLAHQIDNLKPNRQRIIGILEHRGDQWREAIAVFLVTNAFLAVRASFFPAALADPVPCAMLQPIYLVIAAARTLHARRPPQAGEQFHALVLVPVLFVKLSEAQHKRTLHLMAVGVKSVLIPLLSGWLTQCKRQRHDCSQRDECSCLHSPGPPP